MNIVKYLKIFMVIGVLLSTGKLYADDTIKVIASFSVLADLVDNIGGERISLEVLVPADTDAHVFQARPAQIRTLSGADVLFVNGLGFEGWMDRLVESSGFSGETVVVSAGANLITGYDHDHGDHEGHEHEEHDHGDHEGHEHEEQDGHENEEHDHDDHDGHEHEEHDHGDHEGHEHEEHDGHEHEEHDGHENEEHDHDDHDGHEHEGHEHEEHGHDEDLGHGDDVDPHAWHDIENVEVYVKNIAEALAKADPENAAYYQSNLSDYLEELHRLEHELDDAFAAIPVANRKIVTAHNAFGYLGRAFAIEIFTPQGFSTESEVSAGDLARVIEEIRQYNVRAVFAENIADSRLSEQIDRETDAALGGVLYSDALTSSGDAPTYIELMRRNVNTIVEALK